MSIKNSLTLGMLLAMIMIAAWPSNNQQLAARIDTSAIDAPVEVPPLDPTFFDIWATDSVDNLRPTVAYNSVHDEYLVVWENDRGATWDIYARRVSSDGTVRSWFAVISNAGKRNWQPAVAYNPDSDEYLVVYAYEAMPGDHDVWMRRIAWDGSWMSPEINVVFDADDQWYPAVAYNNQNNEYLVVYENYWSGGLRDIAAQRIAADGTLLSWRNIATAPNTVRRLPTVAYHAGSNQYLIAYTYDFPTDGDIRGKLASANLGTLSGELNIVDNTNHQDDVAVVAGPNEFLAVWEDGPNLSERSIYARRLSTSGTLYPYIPIASHTGEPCVEPAIAYSPVHGYLLSWRHVLTASDWDVNARIIKPGHNTPADNEFAIDTFLDLQKSPAVACGPRGDCLVAEQDNYAPGGAADYEIRGRFVRPFRVFLPLTLR